MPIVLEAYIGKVTWPTKPTRGQIAKPLWVLAENGNIIA